MGIACTVIENWGCEETNLLIFQLILGVPNQHDFCYMVFLPNSLATFHSTSFFSNYYSMSFYVILFLNLWVTFLLFAWISLCYIPILFGLNVQFVLVGGFTEEHNPFTITVIVQK
jgi:hypothetical protein